MALTLEQLARYSADDFGTTPGSANAPESRFNLGMGTNYASALQNTLAGLRYSYGNGLTWPGTQPNAAGQGSFDSAFYLAQNPDVAKAVQWGAFPSAYAHYNQFGAGEGRAPNSGASALFQGRQTPSMDYGPALTGFGFNPQYYMAQNPDVAKAVQAGQFANPLQHYLQFGAAEGRQSRAAPTFGSTPPNMSGGLPQVSPQSWQGMTGSPFTGGYSRMATMPMLSFLQSSPFASLYGFAPQGGQGLLPAQQAAPQTFQLAGGPTSGPGKAGPQAGVQQALVNNFGQNAYLNGVPMALARPLAAASAARYER